MSKVSARNYRKNLLILRNETSISKLAAGANSSHSTKKYRTDVLINEQLKYLTLLEHELISKTSLNQEDLKDNIDKSIHLVREFKDTQSLSNFDVFDYDMNLSYSKNKIDYHTVESITDSASDELLKVYQRNLIRFEVIKRLNEELVFCRKELQRAMRTQNKLVETSKRVQWLENEIETIILSNQSIKFPMQRKYVEEKNLKIDKIEYVPPTPDPEELALILAHQEEVRRLSLLPKEPEPPVLKPDGEPIEKLEFKWDKMSNGSTDNLLDSDSDANLNSTDSATSSFRDRERDIRSLSSKAASSVSIKDGPPCISPQLIAAVDKEDSTIAAQSQIFKNTELQKELSEIPFWQMPHNRFDYPHFSKQLVAIDPGSYHRLGLAITDSYLNVNSDVDGKLPSLDKKIKLDEDDIELLNLASSMENISKKICNSSNKLAFKSSNKFEDDKNNKMRISLSFIESTKQTDNLFQPKRCANVSRRMSKPEEYKPLVLLPITPLAQTKLNRKISYPRSPSAFATLESSNPMFETSRSTIRLVDQHNLKEQTKFSLYKPRQIVESFFPKDFDFEAEDKKHIDTRQATEASWSQIKPNKDPMLHVGLRYEKIKSLVSVNLKSECYDEKKDAIKHLGLLNVGDNGAIFALTQLLSNESESELIKFEASKSLVLLGVWSEDVCKYLLKYLTIGNSYVKHGILTTIINGKNSQFTDLTEPALIDLIKFLEEMTNDDDILLSLDASICIGKLGIKDSTSAIKRLYRVVVENEDWTLKSRALETLVKLFGARNSQTIEFIMNQIGSSPDWIARGAAVKLLSYLGPSVIFKSEHFEAVYRLCSARLSEDPILEVRMSLGVTIKNLMLFDRIHAHMNKNLESLDEDVRAKAVVSLHMLGVKKTKFINTLVDMLELDTSEQVRTMVLKALIHLSPNNPKVIQAFNNLEKNSKIYQLLQRIKEKQNVHTKST